MDLFFPIAQTLAEGLLRFDAALTGEPDYVPILGAMEAHAFRSLGIGSWEFFTEPGAFVRAQLLMTGYYGFDLPSVVYDVYNIEVEALGQRLLYPEGSLPEVDISHLLLAQKGNLGRLVPPIPGESGRMPYVLEICRLFRDWTGLPSSAYFCTPFCQAVALRGYTNLIRDIRKDPTFVHELLRFLTEEVTIPWLGVLHEASGAASLSGAAAWASFPMIDMKIQQEFVVPYMRRIAEVVPKATIFGQLGYSYVPDPEEFLETQREMGVPVILARSPEPERLGPERFKALSQKHGLPLILCLPAELLRDGPIPEIVARLHRYIEAGAPSGRFALMLNYIPADTPPAHVFAAVAAAKQLGRYPLGDVEQLPLLKTDC